MTEKPMTNKEFAALDKRIADRESEMLDEDESSMIEAIKRGAEILRKNQAAAAKLEFERMQLSDAEKNAIWIESLQPENEEGAAAEVPIENRAKTGEFAPKGTGDQTGGKSSVSFCR